MKIKRPKSILFALTSAGFITMAVYWLTAFRTITWWDSGEYSVAAYVLGVPHPPGSLLLVIFGWFVTKLPLGIPKAFSLNIFAAFIAAFSVIIISYIAFILINNFSSKNKTINHKTSLLYIGIFLSSLVFSFSETLWSHAIKFTPYILTALFTAFILWTIVRWWELADQKETLKYLFLLTFLFGLDLSVHRTNLLMLPGLFFLILFRRPKALLSLKTWLYSLIGLAIGLSIHLLIIPISASNPFLNSNDPSSLTRLWDYISLKQYGGGWLINIFPRSASFWNYQIMDYISVFCDNFLSWHEKLGFIGYVPGFLGFFGFFMLWKNNWRFASSILVFFLLTGLGGVIYFNLPEDFIRPIDRHYLPSFVIFSIWMMYGFNYVLLHINKLYEKRRYVFYGALGIVMVATVVSQIMESYNKCDGSKRYFSIDRAHNLFDSLSENAILFCSDENETYSTWYLQSVEGERPDITICNLNLMNTPWYVSQLISQDPNLPLSFSREKLAQLRFNLWKERTFSIPVNKKSDDYQLPNGIDFPDTLRLRVPPTIANKYIRVQDILVLQIIINNSWQRPIYFSDAIDQPTESWLRPYLRREGVVWQLIPIQSVPVNKNILRKNLFERYVYRGFSDPSITIEPQTKRVAHSLYTSFITLAQAEEQNGNKIECSTIIKKMIDLLPLEKLNPNQNVKKSIKKLLEDKDINSNN